MLASELGTQLERVRLALRDDTRGKVADYIPELATANSAHMAIAVCSVDNMLTAVGDASELFTIQSMCKPLLYAAALAEFGREEVHRYVGVEPAGAAFNALIRLDAANHLPHNPMLNAGAIAVCALLATKHDAEWLLHYFRRLAGRKDIHVDMPVYLSEKSTGDRNRAIAYLLRYFEGLTAPVDDALDLYFQACSLLVNVQDLATIAATLANEGRSPSSGEPLLPPEAVKDVLTVMTTCGLYDGSGRFTFDTGLAAKSGVSGGVLAVSAGKMGIAAYSPLLDEHGNSVRGLRVLETLSRELELHLFAPRPKQADNQEADELPLAELLDEALLTGKAAAGGQPASYSEGLAAIDPELLGIALCTADGKEYYAGDAHTLFSMQSTANPFTYARALEEVGLPAKSGASGALVAVVPGRYGIAVYAPAIDSVGTSVRGAAALRCFASSLHDARLRTSGS